MTAILGYARVSTTGQDLDAQLGVLTAAGFETNQVFTDKFSGAANRSRAGLAAMLQYAREGDIVVVAAIDGLGRSVGDPRDRRLWQRRILLRAMREGIDTATPIGRAVAAITATPAELELELGRERRAGSRTSRRLGSYRPPNRRSSAVSARTSRDGSQRPVNPSTNSPKRSGSAERRHTTTRPRQCPIPRCAQSYERLPQQDSIGDDAPPAVPDNVSPSEGR